MDGIDIALGIIKDAARISAEKNGRALTDDEVRTLKAGHFLQRIAPYLQPASLGDCVSCDGYVLQAEEAPHCPTCARLLREGKTL